MSEAAAASLTSLFGNDELARIERMRVVASRRFTERGRGEHRSRRRGHSTEFKEHRDYVSGDDIRFLDWNLYARLRRPYLKTFHEEEDVHQVLLLDASASMAFGGKWEQARKLAAAFGVMGLAGAERVSAAVFGAQGAALDRLPLRRGRAGRRALFEFLERNRTAAGAMPLEAGIEALLRRHVGRGCVVILSDFLTAGDLPKSFNRLQSSGLEILACQVLSGAELRPELEADLRLVDAETAETLDVSSADTLLELYQDHLFQLQSQLRQQCAARGGRFLSVDAEQPFARVFFEDLRRQGWVR